MPARNGVAGFQENFPGGEYSADEWEFIRAMAAYQKRWNRRYPSWREVFHVALALGYRKVAPPTDAMTRPTAAEKKLAAAAAGKSEIRSTKSETAAASNARPTPDTDSGRESA